MIAQSSFTIDSETEALPTGFLQIRDFYILSGSTKCPLRYATPSQMDQMQGTSNTGLPSTYTILGDTLRFSPKPDAAYTGYLNYYKTFNALFRQYNKLYFRKSPCNLFVWFFISCC